MKTITVGEWKKKGGCKVGGVFVSAATGLQYSVVEIKAKGILVERADGKSVKPTLYDNDFEIETD